MKVAQFLDEHPQVESVQYLGLPDHPLHDLAVKIYVAGRCRIRRTVQPTGEPLRPSDVVLRQRRGREPTRKFFDNLQRIWRATDLGPDQVRGHYPGNLHPSAAGRGGPRPGRISPPTWSASASGRTPRRHHRRSRPGLGGGREKRLNQARFIPLPGPETPPPVFRKNPIQAALLAYSPRILRGECAGFPAFSQVSPESPRP